MEQSRQLADVAGNVYHDVELSVIAHGMNIP
jgi:hypothetical protein